MRIVLRCLPLSLLALALSGCLTGGTPSLAPASANIEALNGGLVGQVSGLSLSGSAQRQALEAEYQALQFGRVGVPVSWEADGYRGEVVPTQLYRIGSQDCRGYTHNVRRGEAAARQVGSACRSGNLWTPV